ncbi:MAG: hypothetical protein ACRD0V_07215 [Acidimicrobiales bacterium]
MTTMTTMTRTPGRVRLLRASRVGHVRWAPPRNPTTPDDAGRWPSGWVLRDGSLSEDHPDAADLAALCHASLTHCCDSQDITRAGEATLREWTR